MRIKVVIKQRSLFGRVDVFFAWAAKNTTKYRKWINNIMWKRFLKKYRVWITWYANGC